MGLITTKHISKKYCKKLRISLAKHISDKIFEAHKHRNDKDLVLKPQDTGRVARELTDAVRDFIRFNTDKPDFWYTNLHYENESEWSVNEELNKLSEDDLKELCIRMGLEPGNKNYMIWLLVQRRVALEQVFKTSRDEINIFDCFLIEKEVDE